MITLRFFGKTPKYILTICWRYRYVVLLEKRIDNIDGWKQVFKLGKF